MIEKAGEKPSLIIFDLNFDAIQPLDLISQLKHAPETKAISLRCAPMLFPR